MPFFSKFACAKDQRILAIRGDSLCCMNFEADQAITTLYTHTNDKHQQNVHLSLRVCAVSHDQESVVIATSDKQVLLLKINYKEMSAAVIARGRLEKSATCAVFDPSEGAFYVGDKFGDLFKFIIAPDMGLEQQLVLGHISILTDVQIWSDPSSMMQSLLITCDRDEKIRASRLDRPYCIEGWMLEHTAYVSGMCLVKAGKEESATSMLVSVGGDGLLAVWSLAQQSPAESSGSFEMVDSLQMESLKLPSDPLLITSHAERFAVAFDRTNRILIGSLHSGRIAQTKIVSLQEDFHVTAMVIEQSYIIAGAVSLGKDQTATCYLLKIDPETGEQKLLHDLPMTSEGVTMLGQFWRGSLRKLRGDALCEHRERRQAAKRSRQDGEGEPAEEVEESEDSS